MGMKSQQTIQIDIPKFMAGAGFSARQSALTVVGVITPRPIFSQKENDHGITTNKARGTD
jgi:hypothetical protein